eukprot:UN05647
MMTNQKFIPHGHYHPLLSLRERLIVQDPNQCKLYAEKIFANNDRELSLSINNV